MAEVREVRGLPVREEDVRMDCAGIDPERSRGDVRVLQRLCVDEEHGRRGVAHQHALAVAEHRAGVHADPVAHAHRIDLRDFERDEADFSGRRLHERCNGFDYRRAVCFQEDAVRSLFEHVERHLRILLVLHFRDDLVGLGHEVLERDDRPVARGRR